MDELDRIARNAAQDVRAEAARVADTEQALTDVHLGIRPATVTSIESRSPRRTGLMVAVGTAVAATLVGLVVISQLDRPTAVGTEDPTPVTAPVTTPATTLPAETTEAPTTTVEPTTTAVPTTLPPGAVDPQWRILSVGGVGPATMGMPAGEAVAALTPLLGAPASDVSVDYPVLTASGAYAVDALDGSTTFAYQRGRTVCFPNEVCVAFGGPTTNDLKLVGWTYYPGYADVAPADPAVGTTTGIGIRSRWSDYAATIPPLTGVCYSVAGVDVDGVRITLESQGESFMIASEDGMSYMAGNPDPSTVYAIGMESGTLPMPYTDC